jgi:hypothetical protein
MFLLSIVHPHWPQNRPLSVATHLTAVTHHRVGMRTPTTASTTRTTSTQITPTMCSMNTPANTTRPRRITQSWTNYPLLDSISHNRFHKPCCRWNGTTSSTLAPRSLTVLKLTVKRVMTGCCKTILLQ